MNIYITGDTHRVFKEVSQFCEKNKTTIDDLLILLGDAGINYVVRKGENGTYKSGKSDIELKQYLSSFPITFFCVHGNHEARPNSIQTYKEKDYHGGKVYYEEAYPNILFAKDGEIYELNGNKYFVLGGAYSVDKFYRLINGLRWFSDEQPSADTKTRALDQLSKQDYKVDVILTHTCPLKYIPYEAFLSGIDQSTVDNSTEKFLDGIEEKVKYDKWYCGHYHIDKKIDKLEFMFHSFQLLDDDRIHHSHKQTCF